jgi:hypothetical protein
LSCFAKNVSKYSKSLLDVKKQQLRNAMKPTLPEK